MVHTIFVIVGQGNNSILIYFITLLVYFVLSHVWQKYLETSWCLILYIQFIKSNLNSNIEKVLKLFVNTEKRVHQTPCISALFYESAGNK